jgi:hypothetical protein
MQKESAQKSGKILPRLDLKKLEKREKHFNHLKSVQNNYCFNQ